VQGVTWPAAASSSEPSVQQLLQQLPQPEAWLQQLPVEPGAHGCTPLIGCPGGLLLACPPVTMPTHDSAQSKTKVD